MNVSDHINPGMSLEQSFSVEEQHLAKHVGSGSVRVLASPWMIAFMERVSHQLLAIHLPNGFSNVGFALDVRHVAPSPLGSKIKVRAEVVEVSGFQVAFDVMAWDEYEQIGKGRHLRMVIQTERFLKKVASKIIPTVDSHD